MKASKILSLVFVIMMSLWVVTIQPVNPQSSGPIFIRISGIVEGTDKIKRDGNVYTFTDDIDTREWATGIAIQRDNIVVDGAGHLLKGYGPIGYIDSVLLNISPSTGISLKGRNNVVIKNLQIWGFNWGFLGDCCTNIKILENNIEKTAMAIGLNRCSHSIISNNLINNSGSGISLASCSYNTFSGNYITDSSIGIYFQYACTHNTVSGNKIIKSGTYGIAIYLDSDYNLISGNNITDNYSGIVISSSPSSNHVSGNHIKNNKAGIVLVGKASNNVFSGNHIKRNKIGIRLESGKNIIHHNNFITNTKQVDSDGSKNTWDDGKEGNYWHDYTGQDLDGDGIGDTPYVIDSLNQDDYPLVIRLALPELPGKPSVIVLSPENKTYATESVALNFVVNKTVMWMGYSLDEQENVTVTENTTLTGLSNGLHTLTFYANDTFGYTGTSETIYFSIETQLSEPFPTTWIVATIAIIAVVGAALLVYFIKIRKTTKEIE